MKIAHILVIVVLGGGLLLVAHPALAKSAAELYQEGLMKENAEGDLEAAIRIYQKIVKKHTDQPNIAAKAQLHIGMCYEKQGREQAKEAYKNVIERFPNEAEIVQQAKARLQTLEEAEQVKRPAIGAGPEKTQAMIEELDRKRERVQSFRASTMTTMEVMGKQTTIKASMLLKRPNRSRMEMTMSTGRTVNIFDGEMIWSHQLEMNMVSKIDVKRLRNEVPDYETENDILNPFQGLDREGIRYIRATSLNGETVHVFQGTSDGRMSQMGYGQIRTRLGRSLGWDDRGAYAEEDRLQRYREGDERDRGNYRGDQSFHPGQHLHLRAA